MNIDYILMAHGIGGKGRVSFPVIESFIGKSNDIGTEIQFTWKNPSIVEFQKVTMFSSTTNISNLSYKDLIDGNYKKEVDSKINNYTMKGLKHNDHIYVKIFPIYLSVGEEVVGQGSALDIIVKDIVPPSTITNMNIEPKDGELSLSWTNPTDVDFEKVVIKYKIGAINSITDGTLAYEGKNTNVNITGLTNEIEYTIRAFTVDKAGNINSKSSMIYKATPTAQRIYGVVIDETNANPATAVTYTDDAVGFTPAKGNNGAFNWGSWESIIKDEFKIRPCVLNNPAKTVNYYLDYDNYNLKATGGASNLTGTDGDVMIEFGQELWWKFSRVGSKLKIQLSNKEFDGAVKHAFEIEEGYNQLSFYPLTLLQILFLIMFKNRDTQTALGRGYVDGNSAYSDTGASNNRPFMYGESTGKQQIKFLGVEDYWGNRRQWIDGCFYDASRNMMIGKTNFNDTGAGYSNNGVAVLADGGGYIDTIQGGNNTGFIPKSFGGSATTHYSDYGYVNGGKLPLFGGNRSDGASAGGFYLHSTTAAYSIAGIGGRLSALLGKKLYIGVYLGATVGGKLRSISGQVSENNKTIGNFRTLAKANN